MLFGMLSISIKQRNFKVDVPFLASGMHQGTMHGLKHVFPYSILMVQTLSIRGAMENWLKRKKIEAEMGGCRVCPAVSCEIYSSVLNWAFEAWYWSLMDMCWSLVALLVGLCSWKPWRRWVFLPSFMFSGSVLEVCVFLPSLVDSWKCFRLG